jgi:nucleoside-diphosphate-sugar epimerase
VPITIVGARGFVGRRIVDALAGEPEVLSAPHVDPERLPFPFRGAIRNGIVVWVAGNRPPAAEYMTQVYDLRRFMTVAKPKRLLLVSSAQAAQPFAGYANAKWLCEIAACRAPWVKIARLVTCYGNVDGREPVDRLAVIDRWLRQSAGGDRLACDRGTAVDMMHVDDAAHVIADLVREPWTSTLEQWDVGSGIAWKLQPLAEQIASARDVPVLYVADRPVGSVAGGGQWPRYETALTWDPPGWIRTQLQEV